MNEIDAFIEFKSLLNSLQPYSIDLSLDRTKFILEKLGNPQNNFQSIIIGGTNGKGSVCQFLTDVLIDAGLRVGTYTSPHLIQINERFKVNNIPVNYSTLLKSARYIHKNMFNTKLTYFEFLTVLAFMVFKDFNIKYAVLEVGMGGEFDAVNVVKPILSILTRISLDHEEYLGKTHQEIAQTKAKIMKNIGVVGKNSKTVTEIIRKNSTSKLFFVDDSYKRKANSTNISMHGISVRENLSTALLSIDVLNKYYDLNLKYESLKKSFWPGRFEVIESKDKTYILDGAHNKNAVSKLVLSIQKYKNMVLIFSALNRKDWKNNLKILMPHFSKIKLTKISYHNFSADLESLKNFLIEQEYKGKVEIFENVNEAIWSTFYEEDKTYVISGSLYLVGEAKSCYLSNLFLP